MSPVILPMVGTMTIITTFISPYFVKYGWKFTERYVKGQDKNKGDQQQQKPPNSD
jgi:monovalent cation:H+ antiporter-2, CPA2 family